MDTRMSLPYPDCRDPSLDIVHPTSEEILAAFDPETRKWLVDRIGEKAQLILGLEYSYQYHIGIPYRNLMAFYFTTEDDKTKITIDHTKEGPLICLELEVDGKKTSESIPCLEEKLGNIHAMVMNFHDDFGK